MRPGEHRLRRADRLRTSRDFQRVSRRGRRASSRCFVILAAPREDETAFDPGAPRPGCGAGARLGLTVSRRVGRAVARNRVKRRVREWFRTGAVREAPVDLVVIARPGAAALSFQELARELDGLAERVLAAPR